MASQTMQQAVLIVNKCRCLLPKTRLKGFIYSIIKFKRFNCNDALLLYANTF
jgi:hypothetical protein